MNIFKRIFYGRDAIEIECIESEFLLIEKEVSKLKSKRKILERRLAELHGRKKK